MSLATKLKELRMRAGQSLQQVADAVGVSKAHIWELEAGRSTNPGLELLKKLAEHFRVTVSFLSDDTAETTDAAALQFFREFGGELSGKDWDALRSVAERLKGNPK
jgi:transcriptional regulator with XRE-family HTH domain